MDPHYRHTQVGWVILGVMAAIFAFVWSRLPPEAAAAARIPMLLVAALPLLVFSALTVEVDAEAIRLRFGIGLVRKRIPLGDVKSLAGGPQPLVHRVGDPPGTGRRAVECLGIRRGGARPRGGRRFRIGTDEPAALVSAIKRVEGEAPARPPPGTPGRRSRARPCLEGLRRCIRPGRRPRGRALLVAAPAAGGRRGPRRLRGDTLFYGDSFSAAEITAVSLEPGSPACS